MKKLISVICILLLLCSCKIEPTAEDSAAPMPTPEIFDYMHAKIHFYLPNEKNDQKDKVYASLKELYDASDAVVTGRMYCGYPPEGYSYTNFEVTQVFKGDFENGKKAEVYKNNGEYDPNPLPKTNGHYLLDEGTTAVLFLSSVYGYSSDAPLYNFTGGAQGAFIIEDGTVVPSAEIAGFKGAELSDFISMLNGE